MYRVGTAAVNSIFPAHVRIEWVDWKLTRNYRHTINLSPCALATFRGRGVKVQSEPECYSNILVCLSGIC